MEARLQFQIIKVRTIHTFPVGCRDFGWAGGLDFRWFDWVGRLGRRDFGYSNEVIKLWKFQLALDNFHFIALLRVVISLLKLNAGPPHSSFLLL